MKVVQHLLNMDASIYTVHDNFITVPAYVKSIPTIYTWVFMNMGPPLLWINDFIIDNLIHPFYQSTLTHPIHIYKNYQPLPIDDLRDFMLSIAPKEKKKLWKTKSKEILKYYQNYLDAVCECGEDAKQLLSLC